MEVDRLSTGEKISAVSAIALFILMFFDWFGAKVSGFSGSLEGGGSAWDALDVIPIFLMAAIIVALAVAVIRLTDADVEPPFSLNTLVAALGGLAVILILYRIINPPDIGRSRRRLNRCHSEDLDLRQPRRRRRYRLRRL